MTDIEAKALALAIEVNTERNMGLYRSINRKFVDNEALCRAIEKHEAYKQEVSDVAAMMLTEPSIKPSVQWALTKFIIPKPKPDPLVEVLHKLGWDKDTAADLRAALEARGLTIITKEKD